MIIWRFFFADNNVAWECPDSANDNEIGAQVEGRTPVVILSGPKNKMWIKMEHVVAVVREIGDDLGLPQVEDEAE